MKVNLKSFMDIKSKKYINKEFLERHRDFNPGGKLMKLNDYFKIFDGEISLNPQREDRINSALINWKGKLENNDTLKDLYSGLLTQGSYATETAIRPQNNNEFDIDTILILKVEDGEKPKAVIKLLADVLKEYDAFKDKIITKDRCVRIKYAGDFHMDIVPVKPTSGEHLLIPCKSEDEWKETNPIGFKKWVCEKNSNFGYKLAPITRIIKQWRDRSVGKETAPKSILLTTIIGNNIEKYNSTADSLVYTLENMVANLDEVLDEDGEPYVENPSLKGENLARDWNREKYDIFKKKLSKFATDARIALNEEDDKDKSIEEWRNIFGPRFPNKLPTEVKMAAEIVSGTMYVNSSGTLNNIEGKKIEPHRFFGGDIFD